MNDPEELINYHKAEEIVLKYAAFIENHSHLTAFPKSAFPYAEAEIIQAFNDYSKYLKQQDKLTKEIKSSMDTLFGMLFKFIDDDKAARVNRIQDKFRNGIKISQEEIEYCDKCLFGRYEHK